MDYRTQVRIALNFFRDNKIGLYGPRNWIEFYKKIHKPEQNEELTVRNSFLQDEKIYNFISESEYLGLFELYDKKVECKFILSWFTKEYENESNKYVIYYGIDESHKITYMCIFDYYKKSDVSEDIKDKIKDSMKELFIDVRVNKSDVTEVSFILCILFKQVKKSLLPDLPVLTNKEAAAITLEFSKNESSATRDVLYIIRSFLDSYPDKTQCEIRKEIIQAYPDVSKNYLDGLEYVGRSIVSSGRRLVVNYCFKHDDYKNDDLEMGNYRMYVVFALKYDDVYINEPKYTFVKDKIMGRYMFYYDHHCGDKVFSVKLEEQRVIKICKSSRAYLKQFGIDMVCDEYVDNLEKRFIKNFKPAPKCP